MELVGIDFGTCNIKVVRRAGESYKNFRIDNTSNDLKKGTANKVFYRDNELLLGDKATKGRNRCKTVEEQNNYIENIKEHLQEKNWKQTLADGQIKTAGDVTGDIMQYIYHRFSEELQESIDAVITVPVIFSEYQINIIRKAAEDAGFHVKKIISEPFASFVYLMQDCIEAMEKRLHHVLMFDIGGGTLDICLISCGVKEGQYEVSVQSAIGVDRGGNEINDEILNDILFNKNKEMFQAVLYQDEKDAHKAFRNRVNRYSVMEEIEDLKNEMFHDEIKKQSKTIEFSFEKPDYDEDIEVTATEELQQLCDIGKAISHKMQESLKSQASQMDEYFELITDMERIVEEQSKVIQCLQGEKESASVQLDNVKNELQKKNEELKKWEENYNQQKKKYEGWSDNIAELSKIVLEYEGKRDETEKTKEKLEEERAGLAKERGEWKETIKRLEEEKKTAETNQEEFKNKYLEEEKMYLALNKAYKELKDEKNVLEQENQNLQEAEKENDKEKDAEENIPREECVAWAPQENNAADEEEEVSAEEKQEELEESDDIGSADDAPKDHQRELGV